jgi:hypothetical protein
MTRTEAAYTRINLKAILLAKTFKQAYSIYVRLPSIEDVPKGIQKLYVKAETHLDYLGKQPIV